MMGKFKQKIEKLLEGGRIGNSKEKETSHLSTDQMMQSLYSSERADCSPMNYLGSEAAPLPKLNETLKKNELNSVDSLLTTLPPSVSKDVDTLYSYENIDLKTVKPLSKNKPSKSPIKRKSKKNHQLKIDYGPRYTQTLPSFKLLEPITTLALSSQALQGLASHGKKNLQDVIEISEDEWLNYKGIGQGHVDEIYEQLNEYLEDLTDIYQCERFDPASLFRVCLGATLTENQFLVIEKYQLSDLLPNHHIQGASLKHIQGKNREEMVQKGIELFQTEQLVQRVKKQIQKLIEAYVYYWMAHRSGLETKDAIYEHLITISEDEATAERVLHFIKEIFFQGKEFLSSYLTPINSKAYVLEPYLVQYYEKLITQAKSYFYKRGLSYTFQQLCGYMHRENIKEWFCYPPGFLEKGLRISSAFDLYKKSDNKLWISAT